MKLNVTARALKANNDAAVIQATFIALSVPALSTHRQNVMHPATKDSRTVHPQEQDNQPGFLAQPNVHSQKQDLQMSEQFVEDRAEDEPTAWSGVNGV